MANRSSKDAQRVSLSIVPNEGLDFSSSSVNVGENALRIGQNWYYEPSSNRLTSRPGVECVTTENNKLSAEITKLHTHYNGSTTHLIAACADGKLYQMTQAVLEGATPAWTEIGALSVAGVKPSLLTFNTKLLIADNHTAVRYWDSGGTYGTIAGSPANCTELTQGRNRVIANSGAAGALDAVYFSDVEDETTWSTTVRAGYKDGMEVNALEMFGSDLIVSKLAVDGGLRKLFRVNIQDSTPANWYAEDLIPNRAAQSPHGMIGAWNDVLFFDDAGVFSLAGVDSYGDINILNRGDRINSSLAYNNTLTIEEFAYAPRLAAVFMLLDGASSFYIVTPGVDANGNSIYRFLQWRIENTRVTSCATLGENTYFSTGDGRLLRLTEDDVQDEISAGTSVYFTQTLRSKQFQFNGYDGNLKRTSMQFTPLNSGSGCLEIVLADEKSTYTLKEFSVSAGGELIGGIRATTETIGGTYATGTRIGELTTTPSDTVSKQIARSTGLMFQMRLTGGARAEIGNISAEISAPLGR